MGWAARGAQGSEGSTADENRPLPQPSAADRRRLSWATSLPLPPGRGLPSSLDWQLPDATPLAMRRDVTPPPAWAGPPSLTVSPLTQRPTFCAVRSQGW
ncbi:hypothetical protein NDU88_000746 [Pleurodeles waltl]|uniref:Uncharacterized protein n=1 Tax=Pleurodeles waltl TaxID=8319 RepID=A0AAV7V9T5_PLEWA|nr:hypothetical protein NDU88_000746 [Pleurodeles waltl]